ncbi:MAG: SH3 domain-containing protein, partial [Clostridia bacterium]|nr:SH3 domain-containing protein [Clostridia bacterium]
TTDENAIVSIEKGMSESAFVPSEKIVENDVKVGVILNDTIAYQEPNKYDTAIAIPKDAEILIFDQTSTLSGYIQGVYRGKCVYIFDNGISTDKQNVEINQVYIATENLRAYKYPDSKEFVDVERSQLVTVYDDAFGIGGDSWYRVKIDENLYFVLRSQVEEYSAPTPVGDDTKAVYGRAKADRAGGEVNVYQYSDETSTVLFKVTDGTKVEIIETVGDFYKVKYGENYGYMSKDEVKLDGLTTVQIVAIVLAVVVLAAGVVIFFITRKIKQDSEKED